jgi:hypothetical protein
MEPETVPLVVGTKSNEHATAGVPPTPADHIARMLRRRLSSRSRLAGPARHRPTAWRFVPELVIGVCLLLVYLPALTLTYGLKDDYTLLARAHGYVHAGMSEPAVSTRLGRPVFGLLTWGLDSLLPSVGSLWVARTLSAVGMVLFAIVLYHALRRLVPSRAVATLITLLICSLPPFLVYVGWATLFCVPYSAALGALAALAAARASDASGRTRARRLLTGTVLLLFALGIYQPTAMAFWLVALIVALSRRHSRDSLGGLVRCVALVGVPAMIGAYLMLKIGVWTLGGAGAARSGLVSDIPAKLRWIPEPFGLALNLFNMPQSTAFATAIACVVFSGALLFCRDCARRTRTTILLLAAIAIPLSFSPNLLSQENYATFRTVGPLTATFALFTALVFVSIERDGSKAWRRVLGRGSLFAVTALSVLLGFNHLRTLIALPLSREWRLVLAETARLPPHPKVVGFLAPTFGEGPITTRYGVRDEFGAPSSASTWADPALAWLAARQTGITSNVNLKVVVTVGSHATRQPGIPYLDMRNLRRLR